MSGAVAPRVQTELKAVSTIMVAKHSFNLIDLIEVGDYVNGYKVLYNCEETEKEQCNGEYRKCIIVATGKTGEWKMIDWDIESIVTREQFEDMKYVVGGKEE